jgi:hypothetical protein
MHEPKIEPISGLYCAMYMHTVYSTVHGSKTKGNGRLGVLCKCEDDFHICDFKKISEFTIASNLFNFSNTAYSEGALEYLQYDEEDLNDCVQNVFGAFLD